MEVLDNRRLRDVFTELSTPLVAAAMVRPGIDPHVASSCYPIVDSRH